MIKNLKPQKNSRFNQGYLNSSEFPKFKGTGNIPFRSSLEKKFCFYCEKSSQIESWTYEEIEIPYFDPVDEKTHRYYPDFILKMTDGTVVVVEVKPSSHIEMPKISENATLKAKKNFKDLLEIYRKNSIKFKAALKFCADRGWVFKIITENFFKK